METRESKKSLYISTYMQKYKAELAGTIWTEEGQESWIELAALNAWDERKKEVKDKADAFMWAVIDAKKRCEKTREAIKKALNK